MQVALAMTARWKEIQSLLRTNGRGFHEVIFPALCSVSYLEPLFRKLATKNDLISIGASILFIHCESAFVGLFIICTEIVMKLTHRNQELLHLVRSGRDLLDLIAVKWEIRDAITKTNSVFANVLAVHYVGFFMGVIYYIAMLVQDMGELELFLNAISIVAKLLDAARRSSILTALSLETEFHLRKRF